MIDQFYLGAIGYLLLFISPLLYIAWLYNYVEKELKRKANNE